MGWLLVGLIPFALLVLLIWIASQATTGRTGSDY